MARKKKEAHPENHERWLVSYADFITLLFAFFVVMFASSQTDKGKAQQMQEAIKKALDEDQIVTAISGILGGTPNDRGKGNAQMKGPGGQEQLARPEKMAELLPSMEHLEKELETELREGKMQMKMESRGLVISFQQTAFFPSGGDEIPPETYSSIEKVAAVIQSVPNPIRCEGHTDAQPLKSSARFGSNWELSAARAIAMMELLVACCEVSRDRFSISGYAENAPIADNEDDQTRRQNRRVDIVILNKTGLIAEPTAAAQKYQDE